MEAEFSAELENYNQNIFLYELRLLDGLKEEYPKCPQRTKIANFQTKKF